MSSQIAIGSLAVSAVVCYAQHSRSVLYFLGLSSALWLLQVFTRAVYSVLIRPHFLSPLRHLPQAAKSHWLLGQGPKIFKDPPGMPMREW